MGSWWSGGGDPETGKRADRVVSAQHGGVVNTPQFSGVNVGGNLTVQVNQGLSAAVAQRSVPAEDGVSADNGVPADKRLLSVRKQFVERVSDAVLDQLLDQLLEREVITDGEMQSMRVKARADKARDLMDTVRRKGPGAGSVMIAALRDADPCLSGTLRLL